MTTVQGDDAATMLQRKSDIWAEVHAAKTTCPTCGKKLSFRTLRWKHVCRRRGVTQVLLDADLAEKRRAELQQKAVETLRARLHQRQGEPSGEQVSG